MYAAAVMPCVQGYQQRVEYIAAQAPMTETAEDFWHMVVQCNCRTVAMVTNLTEGGKEKCVQVRRIFHSFIRQ